MAGCACDVCGSCVRVPDCMSRSSPLEACAPLKVMPCLVLYDIAPLEALLLLEPLVHEVLEEDLRPHALETDGLIAL